MDSCPLLKGEKNWMKKLNLALEQMNGWTWGKYCDAAIKVAIRMGVSIIRMLTL
jgi:hypothetical protein